MVLKTHRTSVVVLTGRCHQRLPGKAAGAQPAVQQQDSMAGGLGAACSRRVRQLQQHSASLPSQIILPKELQVVFFSHMHMLSSTDRHCSTAAPAGQHSCPQSNLAGPQHDQLLLDTSPLA
jgi:hypothetical protein